MHVCDLPLFQHLCRRTNRLIRSNSVGGTCHELVPAQTPPNPEMQFTQCLGTYMQGCAQDPEYLHHFSPQTKAKERLEGWRQFPKETHEGLPVEHNEPLDLARDFSTDAGSDSKQRTHASKDSAQGAFCVRAYRDCSQGCADKKRKRWVRELHRQQTFPKHLLRKVKSKAKGKERTMYGPIALLSLCLGPVQFGTAVGRSHVSSITRYCVYFSRAMTGATSR